MSIDILQEKIRKTKSPIIVDLSVEIMQIPENMRQDKTVAEAYHAFCSTMLDGLKEVCAGVRFDFCYCAMLGALEQLRQLLEQAQNLGYYVLLDAPSILSLEQAERAARLLDDHSGFPCHGLIANPYIGSDAIKAFVPYAKEGKSVLFAVRAANKSAAELQDMMTGSRLVHVAAADLVKRHGEAILGKCGYSQLGALTAATNANAVMGLRSKYNRLFLLVEGLELPGGNGKNCSLGFDRFGHGCAISVGSAITAAWQENGEVDAISAAQQAAERIRSNISRYITIL